MSKVVPVSRPSLPWDVLLLVFREADPSTLAALGRVSLDFLTSTVSLLYKDVEISSVKRLKMLFCERKKTGRTTKNSTTASRIDHLLSLSQIETLLLDFTFASSVPNDLNLSFTRISSTTALPIRTLTFKFGSRYWRMVIQPESSGDRGLQRLRFSVGTSNQAGHRRASLSPATPPPRRSRPSLPLHQHGRASAPHQLIWILVGPDRSAVQSHRARRFVRRSSASSRRDGSKAAGSEGEVTQVCRGAGAVDLERDASRNPSPSSPLSSSPSITTAAASAHQTPTPATPHYPPHNPPSIIPLNSNPPSSTSSSSSSLRPRWIQLSGVELTIVPPTNPTSFLAPPVRHRVQPL